MNDAQVPESPAVIYHRYPMRSLVKDYVRAVAGLVIALVPLTLGQPGLFFFTVLSALAALFFFYGLRTLNQQLTAYEIRPDGLVSHGPRRRFFSWDEVSNVRLRYYSTQRDKTKRDFERGWMELKLIGPAGKLRIDSDVQGFDTIMQAVAQAVGRRRLELDETTRENLRAFEPKPKDNADEDDESRSG